MRPGQPAIAHLSDRRRRRRGHQTRDRPAGHALAGAALADEAEDLPLAERERDAVDGADDAAVGGDVRVEVRRPSRMSSPSPGIVLDAAASVTGTQEVGEAVAEQAEPDADDHDRDAGQGRRATTT